MTTYPAIEPDAYRWRQKGSKLWIYDPTPKWLEEHRHEVDVEPLYGPTVVGELRSQLVKARAALREAEELLETAYYAHQKMGLEGCGNHGLSHEVRMFAMHFSQPETPKTPQHVILSGDGRYWKWRNDPIHLSLPDDVSKPSDKGTVLV